MKGVQCCSNKHIDEEILKKAVIIAWNELLDDSMLKKKWEVTAEFGNSLEQYRALQFVDITEDA